MPAIGKVDQLLAKYKLGNKYLCVYVCGLQNLHFLIVCNLHCAKKI